MLVHGLVQRHDDELVEAPLALGDMRSVAVAEGGARQAELTLLVALVEELGIDAQRPQHVQIEGLRAVGNVAALECEGKQFLAMLGRELYIASVQQLPSEVVHALAVLGKIRLQDHLHSAGSEADAEGGCQLTQEVAVRREQQGEGDGTVHVLQWTLVVVDACQWRLRADVEGVRAARMAHIMRGGRHERSQVFYRFHQRKARVLQLHEVDHAVEHISAVHGVVVRNPTDVPGLNAVQEGQDAGCG
mmetsp:Transcript_93499/g.217384  ORF Transcript_93499/g.217384 Transcript_93499/m.217384 type:complete len:246 (-) Transcript_93499:57-794(-)